MLFGEFGHVYMEHEYLVFQDKQFTNHLCFEVQWCLDHGSWNIHWAGKYVYVGNFTLKLAFQRCVCTLGKIHISVHCGNEMQHSCCGQSGDATPECCTPRTWRNSDSGLGGLSARHSSRSYRGCASDIFDCGLEHHFPERVE